MREISGDYSGWRIVLNPMNAVAEMGSSLRARARVVSWRVNGESQC